MSTHTKRLSDVLPSEFDSEFSDTRAASMKSTEIVCAYDGRIRRWPGKEKHVMIWWQLNNGYAVGWNENPARGWSFPVINIRKLAS